MTGAGPEGGEPGRAGGTSSSPRGQAASTRAGLLNWCKVRRHHLAAGQTKYAHARQPLYIAAVRNARIVRLAGQSAPHPRNTISLSKDAIAIPCNWLLLTVMNDTDVGSHAGAGARVRGPRGWLGVSCACFTSPRGLCRVAGRLFEGRPAREHVGESHWLRAAAGWV